jgi:hypothetical protein
MEKRLLVRAVMGALNPADIATKRLSAARLESLCYFLGIWRGNNLEGSHDPGNIFRHLTNQRPQGHSQAQINLLISALSVLTQLQGCSDAMDSLATGGCFNAVFLFTWLLGLIGYIYLAIRPGEPLKNFDFVRFLQPIQGWGWSNTSDDWGSSHCWGPATSNHVKHIGSVECPMRISMISSIFGYR